MLLQLIEKPALAAQNLLARGCDGEPPAAIDLREFLLLAGVGRPFHRERIAHNRRGIDISLHGPRVHELAARLLERFKRHELPAQPRAGLFVEFALRGRQRIVAFLELPLGHGPRSRVLSPPERSPGVDQENLAGAVAKSVEENTGADALGHGRVRRPMKATTRSARACWQGKQRFARRSEPGQSTRATTVT